MTQRKIINNITQRKQGIVRDLPYAGRADHTLHPEMHHQNRVIRLARPALAPVIDRFNLLSNPGDRATSLRSAISDTKDAHTIHINKVAHQLNAAIRNRFDFDQPYEPLRIENLEPAIDIPPVCQIMIPFDRIHRNPVVRELP